MGGGELRWRTKLRPEPALMTPRSPGVSCQLEKRPNGRCRIGLVLPLSGQGWFFDRGPRAALVPRLPWAIVLNPVGVLEMDFWMRGRGDVSDALRERPQGFIGSMRGCCQGEDKMPGLGVRRRKAGWKPALRFGCGSAALWMQGHGLRITADQRCAKSASVRSSVRA